MKHGTYLESAEGVIDVTDEGPGLRRRRFSGAVSLM
ncbi:MAG: hypothetical protein QOH36_690 [Actinomycetota bacterium]|nr:hypothetical protein [Actinomycetota bacterium]